MVLAAEDPALQLLAGGRTLVLAQVTSSAPDEPMPRGSVLVQDEAGRHLSEIPLVPPTGNLLGSPSDAPSFQRAYSAVVPGALVFPGMQLKVQLADGQISRQLHLRVGPGHAIRLITVPIRIGAKVGRTIPSIPEVAAARLPIASVREEPHAEFTSQKVSDPPNGRWTTDALLPVLNELIALRELEQAAPDTHYVGTLPPFLDGGGGIATRPGTSLLLINTLDAAADHMESVLLHELGHNFGLPHAACTGNEPDIDPDFPYPQANLGKPGHYVFPYRNDRQAFIDPRDSTLHDVMSYCDGRAAFSDYNYLKLQKTLDQQQPADLAAMQALPGPLLYISGSIQGDRVELSPLKRFDGRLKPIRTGQWELRLSTSSGEQVVSFHPDTLEDAGPGTALFNLTVPDPGVVQRVRVMRGGTVLLDRTAPSSIARTRALNAPSTQPSLPGLALRESAGSLALSWDVSSIRHLSLVHVGARRTVLALDLTSGFANLSTQSLPAGGSFEFIASDGINSIKLQRPR